MNPPIVALLLWRVAKGVVDCLVQEWSTMMSFGGELEVDVDLYHHQTYDAIQEEKLIQFGLSYWKAVVEVDGQTAMRSKKTMMVW